MPGRPDDDTESVVPVGDQGRQEPGAVQGAGRRRALTGVLVVGLPVALAAVAVAGGALAGRPDAPDGLSSCITGPADATTLARLLSARDRWVVDGGVLPPLEGRPATLRERLGGAPVASWSTAVAGVDGAAPTLRATATLRYRLAGDTVDTVRRREVGAVRGGGCWVLRDDDPAPGAVPDLWDLGPVRVSRTAGAVVVASADLDGTAVRTLATDAGRAVDAVGAVWAPGPRRPVVVLAPRRVEDAAAVAGTPLAALEGLAAVTYGPPSPGAAGPSEFGDARVLVVPDGFAALTPDGRRFVLAHELTHVATNAVARAAVPAWFQECFADVVGWSALGLAAARVDGLVGADLRAARLTALPVRLPARADFDARRGDPARAYALADAACLALGDGPDASRLATVYRAAARVPAGPAQSSAAPASSTPPPVAAPDAGPSAGPSGGSPSAPTDAPDTAVLAAAGTDARRLVQAWHRRILDLAGPIPGSTP